MRAAAKLSAKLERGVLAYATAASAAGMGLLGLPQPANAKVVYTVVYKVIPPRSHCNIDLNHDGTTDFRIHNLLVSTSTAWSGLYATAFRRNAVVITQSQHQVTVARALKKGQWVGPRKKFQFAQARMVGKWDQTTFGSSGSWVNVRNRYLGLKFKVDGETHFGWARVSVKVDLFVNITATLTGFAYETIPNKPIIAGNRGSTTGQGPEAEPVSLGRLALGAAGRTQHGQKVETSH